MPKIELDKVVQEDKIVLRSKKDNRVLKVVFPNGIQVGLPTDMLKDAAISIPPKAAPTKTDHRLYNENGTLMWAGSEVGSGAGVGGSSLFTEAAVGKIFTTGSVGISTSGAAKTSLDVVHDYNATTFENQLTGGEGGGDILKYGTGTTVAGELYYLHTDGSWADANANATSSGGSQFLGVAMGTSPTDHGMLLKGFVRISSTLINGTAAVGYPVFVSTTAGEYAFTAPSGANDFVRIVGYCLDTHTRDMLLYFNPDSTWVEIS